MDLFEKKLENINEDLEFKKIYKKYLKNKNQFVYLKIIGYNKIKM